MTARSQHCSNGQSSVVRLASIILVKSGLPSLFDKAEIRLGRSCNACLFSLAAKYV